MIANNGTQPVLPVSCWTRGKRLPFVCWGMREEVLWHSDLTLQAQLTVRHMNGSGLALL